MRELARRRYDFSVVVEALREYARTTGQEAIALSGWDLDDSEIEPPRVLQERLSCVTGHLCAYAYPKDFRRAKERAAEILGHSLHLGGSPLRAEHVAVLPNATQGLLLALAALKEQGVKRVVVAAPCYFAAVRICETLGLDTHIVPARDFRTGEPDIARLQDAVSGPRGGPRAALLITNPAYSVGVEYGRERLAALLDHIPAETRVLLDESRLGLSWSDEAPWYQADMLANVVVLRSPSKVFFVNGLKTSFLVASPRFIAVAESIGEGLIGSSAQGAEAVALAYLDCWEDWLAELESGDFGQMRQWRSEVVARLRYNLGRLLPALHARGAIVSPVDSGPYALAVLPREVLLGMGSVDIARESGVLVMDSSYFFHTDADRIAFRLNLCCTHRRALEGLTRVFSRVEVTPTGLEPAPV
jgi:DNA-binding transcriptional MocR family regulator